MGRVAKPRFGRRVRDKGRKSKSKQHGGWPAGQQAKRAKAAGAAGAATAPATARPRKASGPSGRKRMPEPRELAQDAANVARRKRRRDAADEARAIQEHGERAAAKLAPPERPSEAAGATACCTRASRWRRSTWGATRRHRSGRRRSWAPSWSSPSRITRRRWRSSSGGRSEPCGGRGESDSWTATERCLGACWPGVCIAMIWLHWVSSDCQGIIV